MTGTLLFVVLFVVAEEAFGPAPPMDENGSNTGAGAGELPLVEADVAKGSFATGGAGGGGASPPVPDGAVGAKRSAPGGVGAAAAGAAKAPKSSKSATGGGAGAGGATEPIVL